MQESWNSRKCKIVIKNYEGYAEKPYEDKAEKRK